MRKVYVRPHYRNLPRRSKQNSSNSWFFRIIGIGIPVFALFYFLSRIPVQVYFAIATLIVALIFCAFLLFASVMIYQRQRRIKRDIEERNSQEYMRQVGLQSQKDQQQQKATHQNYIQQAQTQVQAQQERERLAQIKTRNDMLGFSPPEFEEFVGILFKSIGYRVEQVGKSGDLGADLLLYNAQENLTIVQCKKFSPGKNVGTQDLQKFVGAIVHYRAQKGIFVTTSLFTKHAEEYVKDKPMIQLIDGQKLVSLVHNAL